MGQSTPLSVETFQLKDLVPAENNIECAVWRLRNNRSRGPSGMRADHIKGWMEEARKVERGGVKEEADTTGET